MASQGQKAEGDRAFALSHIIRTLSADIERLTNDGEHQDHAIAKLQQDWAEWIPQIKKIVNAREDDARRMKDLIWRIVSIVLIALLAGGVAWYLKGGS